MYEIYPVEKRHNICYAGLLLKGELQRNFDFTQYGRVCGVEHVPVVIFAKSSFDQELFVLKQ